MVLYGLEHTVGFRAMTEIVLSISPKRTVWAETMLKPYIAVLMVHCGSEQVTMESPVMMVKSLSTLLWQTV